MVRGVSTDAVRAALVDAVSQLRSDLGDEIALELCTLFLRNTPDLLRAMRTGLASDDPHAVGRAAHELKSTAAALGAKELCHTCRELEALAATDSVTVLAPLVDSADRAFVSARDALAAVASELRAAAGA
jgi:two-component system sensor histidine kinase/response regulator